MTIDLSGAYDLALLEQPLTDDWYYFVLTNNNFAFGQDWHCTVEFAEPVENVTAPGISPEADETILAGMAEPLRAYFETVSMEPQARRDLTDAYVEAYTRLLSEVNGTVVSSVSPVLLGNRLSCEVPCLHVADPNEGVIFDDTVPAGEQCQLVGVQWYSMDAGFKLLATEGEHALVLSAHLPQKRYPDAFTELPLFYLFTYEKAAVNDESYAFIYGKLLSFIDVEQYKVYEDEQYVCYEVSELIYSDWEEQAEALAAQRPDTCWDAQIRQRVENIYRYYKENLGGLLEYR